MGTNWSFQLRKSKSQPANVFKVIFEWEVFPFKLDLGENEVNLILDPRLQLLDISLKNELSGSKWIFYFLVSQFQKQNSRLKNILSGDLNFVRMT